LSPIPSDLSRWQPIKHALKRWRRKKADCVLANLHEAVFRERGYESDLWIRWEDGRRVNYPSRANLNIVPEGSDCRWSNAVRLLRPTK
jgi:hypothetical protein